MVHVLIVVRLALIQTHVMENIQILHVRQLVGLVQGVPAGRAQQLVHVRAVQSASHVMRDIICLMAHVYNVKRVIVVLVTIVVMNVLGQHIQVLGHLHAHPAQTVRLVIIAGMAILCMILFMSATRM